MAPRGGMLASGDARPHVQASVLVPQSKTGGVLSSTRFAPILAASTKFMFDSSNGNGFGPITKLTDGNNCRNLDDDLTRCNLVHNEASGNGCAYSGGDYCAVMGVSSENQITHNYQDDCNYFRNEGCPSAPWTSGTASGAFYASWSDLYVA